MAEPLTFLFAPIDGVGHVHACIGLGQQLLDRGHKVYFVASNAWKGKLEAFGFIEKRHQDPADIESTDKWSSDTLSALAPVLPLPPIQKMESIVMAIYTELFRREKVSCSKLKTIVEEVKPDLIIVDDVMHNPGLVEQGVPWVLAASINPLGISRENVPLAFMGEPIMTGNTKLWNEQEEKSREIFKGLFEDVKTWLLENGVEYSKDFTFPFWHKYSPYANIYMYPEELDYTMFRPVPPKWHRFDAFARIEPGTFEIPQQLESLPGKLIYFSMGTIGCCELQLMRKLIDMLSKSPNKFIVSKGPLADHIELPDNMWGEPKLPQTLLLPMVDLVITHGGNNTITESFHFGKRVIVMPLFCDQLDNAQRVQETGLGLFFEPYHVTEQELLGGIETLLADQLLERRMQSISKRIQSSNSQARAGELLIDIARNSTKYFN